MQKKKCKKDTKMEQHKKILQGHNSTINKRKFISLKVKTL